MNKFNDAIFSFTHLSVNSEESESDLSASIHDQNFSNLVANAYNKISESNTHYKDMINMLSQSPQFTSDPQKLLMLQDYLGEYTNHTSLISTLSRKGVSVIETLAKS
ncbi:type III secretion system inner rod subunit SctI [Pantoea ananatis]|uniref:type III secretion system inner rod subunit SctI n=1 Tax=Pantoea ananas TaxID=553 RepID=UPI0021E9ABFB|nr:type III secretion system inner rod subunit SctI [Pantoea ananatis]MCW0309597.1 hypothetical protein [Pantoea ananatis]MCW0341322.1 hypothetical protein [Pantoea ananatis]MCW0359804.1 hypothetical protein [Pantoea ananatis]MCW0364464.1 hypothetical protein [Pantoea ananatis]MCW1776882.1 type III secretion system inner rod subunit SctI [Pantoea ananatis]